MATCNYGHFVIPNNSDVYDTLQLFKDAYGGVHAYVSLGICIPGILMNVLNVAVLTRRSMTSAVNSVLAVIAVSDGLVMLSYILYIYHFRINAFECTASYLSEAWAYFTILHGHLSVVLHTSAMWLSIYLAFTRYLSIRQTRNFKMAKAPKIRNSIASSTVIVLIVIACYFPAYLTFEVSSYPLNHYSAYVCGSNSTFDNSSSAFVYVTQKSAMSRNKDCLLIKALFWSTGLFAKLIPCGLLVIIMVLLVKSLSAVKKRRSILQRKDTGDQRCGTADRTTVMLTAVILVVFLTEFPQGLLSVGVSLFGNKFYDNIYMNMGDFMDLMSLINSSVNFVIYCAMSQAFRTEFRYMIMFWKDRPLGYMTVRLNGKTKTSR